MSFLDVLTIIFFLPVVIVYELVRWCQLLRARALLVKDSSRRPLPIATRSFAILGSRCSIRNALLQSRNDDMMRIRGHFAEEHDGLYMSYHWDFRIMLGMGHKVRPVVVLTDPDLIEIVLKDSLVWYKRNNDESPVGRIIGQSCTRANGENAVRQRKILSSSFRNRNDYKVYLQQAINKFESLLDNRISQHQQNSSTIDMVPLVKSLSIDIVSWMLFGSDTPGIEEFKTSYQDYWSDLRKNIYDLSSPREVTARNEKMSANVLSLFENFEKLIFARRKMLKDNRKIRAYENDNSSNDGGLNNFEGVQEGYLNACVLDKLLEKTKFDDDESHDQPQSIKTMNKDDQKLTLDELIHNCYSFMTAGYETTAHTITICIYHLSLNSLEPSHRDFENPKVLKAHIKESLRLYPPVMQMVRYCIHETRIGEDLTVNAYTTVFVDIAGMHHRESIWGKDCREFKPSRWLVDDKPLAGDNGFGKSSLVDDEKEAAISRARRSWMPFGHGSKSCIGQSIAMMAVEAVILSFVSKYNASRSSDEKLRFTQTPTIRLRDMFMKIDSKGETSNSDNHADTYNTNADSNGQQRPQLFHDVSSPSNPTNHNDAGYGHSHRKDEVDKGSGDFIDFEIGMIHS